jgi:hypothetical protein
MFKNKVQEFKNKIKYEGYHVDDQSRRMIILCQILWIFKARRKNSWIQILRTKILHIKTYF